MPLLESMLTSYQWGFVAFTQENNFVMRAQVIFLHNECENSTFKIITTQGSLS